MTTTSAKLSAERDQVRRAEEQIERHSPARARGNGILDCECNACVFARQAVTGYAEGWAAAMDRERIRDAVYQAVGSCSGMEFDIRSHYEAALSEALISYLAKEPK